MKLNFTYDKEKDTWCLLNYGKSSKNSAHPTAVYEELLEFTRGDEPTLDSTSLFIDFYLQKNKNAIESTIARTRTDFMNVSQLFNATAERVFGVTLGRNLIAYFTTNTRCPYRIDEGFFFVSLSYEYPTPIIFHELWHFYTWERFGQTELDELGDKMYNEIKEALTVLLNIECPELFPPGVLDKGYPQHQELRKEVTRWWQQSADIETVWNNAVNYLSANSPKPA